MLKPLLLALTLSATPPLPAPAAPTGPSDEESFKQLELFARVLSYVQNGYVEKVDQKQLVYGAIKGMLDTLDPHSVFMPPEVFKEMKIDTSGEFGGVGIEIAKKDDVITVVAPVDDTPAARAGIRSGDQLLRIDDEPTKGMDVARASQRLRGPAGKRVTLTIMRTGFSKPQDIIVLRDHIRIVSVEGDIYGGVAHVKIKNFQDRTDAYLKKELDRLRGLNGGKELRGLVLDLRNNPGGLLDQAVAVSDRFLPGNLVIVSTKGRGKSVTEERSKDRDTEHPYPIVVLVNGGTASASEIVAGALQDHARATLMGVPTFGKGSVQTVIELEDGSGLKLTIARYYTPKGRSIQERGIMPDFVVGEVPGRAVSSKDTLREADLKHHFRGESPGEAREEVQQHLPANIKPWEVTAKLADYQLKISLDYLNQAAISAAGPAHSRVSAASP